MNGGASVKYLTSGPDFCKQNRPRKRRFHAASLRPSCGSPLGSTSNPKKTQGLRIRAPRKPEGGRGRGKSQILMRAQVLRKQIKPKNRRIFRGKIRLKNTAYFSFFTPAKMKYAKRVTRYVSNPLCTLVHPAAIKLYNHISHSQFQRRCTRKREISLD